MERNQEDHTSPEQHGGRNIELEIALVKIARALFDYMDSQNDISEMDRLDPLYETFRELANNYHNQTGGLHPDLGFQLVEWAALKFEAMEGTAKEAPSDKFVAQYRAIVKDIIEYLEQEVRLKS